MVAAMSQAPIERVGEASAAISSGLRARLAVQRITGAELARRLGRSQSSISRRLIGDAAWDVDELAAVARALDVDILEIVEPARSAS